MTFLFLYSTNRRFLKVPIQYFAAWQAALATFISGLDAENYTFKTSPDVRLFLVFPELLACARSNDSCFLSNYIILVLWLVCIEALLHWRGKRIWPALC